MLIQLVNVLVFKILKEMEVEVEGISFDSGRFRKTFMQELQIVFNSNLFSPYDKHELN